jgi:hypothetical protein
MSDMYADDLDYGDEDREAVGGALVAAISILSAILVLAGLFYATGAGTRHKAALALNNCEPSLSPSGLPCNTQAMVIGQYEAIVNPAIKELTADTAAYRTNEKRHLAAAEAALMSEVAAEQAMDNGLNTAAYSSQNYATAIGLITTSADAGTPTPSAAILLTPQGTVVANALIKANQALITLTTQQAHSKTLTQLQSFNARAATDGAAVQAQMKLLSSTLKEPITASQEP